MDPADGVAQITFSYVNLETGTSDVPVLLSGVLR